MQKPVVCLDLEGVLVPEIWIAVSRKTRIQELSLTTRDLPDYDELMRRRISILRRHHIKLKDIQRVIVSMRPLPGAKTFLDKLRAEHQVLILSDTFYEFAMPLMKKLGHPTLFCNFLETDSKGYVSGYRLRQINGKEKAVLAIQNIGFKVSAAGDSYNDVTMLQRAERAVFFNPPDKILKEYPKLKAARNYRDLFKALTAC